MSERPKILIVTDYFVPALKAGGPVRSVIGIVDRLSKDFEFLILTKDRDLGDKDHFQSIQRDVWTESNAFQGAKIFYASTKNQSPLALEHILSEASMNLVYVNSLFSKFARSILSLQFRRKIQAGVLFAPRGQLAEPAIAEKAWKKWPYLQLIRTIGLHRAVNWQATSIDESKDITRRFPGSKIHLVPNIGHSRPPPLLEPRPVGDPLRVVFFGRIASKKNIHFALQALQKVNGRVRFDIIGPLEDMNYVNHCKNLASRLPMNIQCEFLGERTHVDLQSLLPTYDVFLNPTLNENFGHTILEALLGGVVPLISDQTFWNFIENEGAGYVRPLVESKFVETIEEICGKSESELMKIRKQAVAVGQAYVNDVGPLERHKEMFRAAILVV